MLWDTAGQDVFSSLTRGYYKGAAAVLYVFSTVDRESFLCLEKWRERVLKECGADVISVLVQNKVDLIAQSQVTSQEVEELARNMRVKLYRICTSNNAPLPDVFEYIAESYIRKSMDMELSGAAVRNLDEIESPSTAPRTLTVGVGAGAGGGGVASSTSSSMMLASPSSASSSSTASSSSSSSSSLAANTQLAAAPVSSSSSVTSFPMSTNPFVQSQQNRSHTENKDGVYPGTTTSSLSSGATADRAAVLTATGGVLAGADGMAGKEHASSSASSSSSSSSAHLRVSGDVAGSPHTPSSAVSNGPADMDGTRTPRGQRAVPMTRRTGGKKEQQCAIS